MPYYRATQNISIEGLMTMPSGQWVDLEVEDLRNPHIQGAIQRGWLEAVPAFDAIGLDTAPIPSDWPTINRLITDMADYARRFPNSTYLCADDPGTHTGRTPRFGWVAYEDGPNHSEIVKQWTITLPLMKETRHELPLFMLRWMETAAGRQEMLRHIVAVAKANQTPPPERPPPRTIWERLTDD